MLNANKDHLSHFNLKVNGAQASRDVAGGILDCTVENSLHLPDMCTIRLHDSQFTYMDAQTFREGAKIEIEASEEQGPFTTLFQGEITSIEMDLAAHGVPTTVIRALDRSHRLHRGRSSRTFVQMTDTDIVKKVGAEAGFNVQADASSQVHDWVLQNNQTNWEFLTERAARNGFRLYVQNERDLFFKKVTDEGDRGETTSLDWGKNLRSFRARAASSPQVDEVTVRGWDPKTKQAIVGRCDKPSGVPRTGEPAAGGSLASRAFGASKMVVVDRPVQSQGEADDMARSICDDIAGGFLEAEGLAYGMPALKPGAMVDVGNLGTRFSGQYQITSTTHTYTPAEGYATQFSISGKKSSSLMSLMEEAGGGGGGGGASGGSGSAGRKQEHKGGIVIGVVTDNKDPENQGRVKVKYPWLTEDHTSHWARIAAPSAGKERGFEFVPEINDEVLVGLEHGDVSRPYILGALWNGVDKAPMTTEKAVTGGAVVRRRIRSRLNHRLTFFDTPDKKGGITLKTNEGHRVEMNDLEKRVLVRTKEMNEILLDDKNGEIHIKDKNGNTITIKSGDNSISISCKGAFNVEAGGDVTIKGAKVNIN